ncbi:hypothetical protein [Halorussus halophilus]|uniref:hypothetical protein n=1 Tax=Halorussus halophilus TaxID=2650975 RepID=UPI0013014DEC|nr:hypothetical protein [Halorussus halophilus]
MNTYADSESRRDARDRPAIPAYGPIDALLGFVMFYVLVDRATPTFVDVIPTVLPSVSPSLVRLGLALALWFVFVVTSIDQIRRQLAALGVITHDAITPSSRRRGTPTETEALLYLVLALVGGTVAAWTFDRGIETAVSLIPVVVTIDVTAFVPEDFAVMVVFFLSFGVASYALDRLLIGGLRATFAE